QKLAESSSSSGATALRVATANSPAAIKAEARKIAEVLGTMGRFDAWSKNFDSLAENLRSRARAAWPRGKVLAQKMIRPFVEWLGLEIAGEFGPAEPSPALVLALAGTRPLLVIDNYHSPSGKPIAETAGAAYVQLINFPGKDGTQTIEDVFRHNADALIKAAKK
ncbi:MAG: ABC transporter substrate-binding protein, partial [Spirochaetales bacterium]|nr:ABC transporter substrate-binding protein [Spirochaetales bacterium]